MVHLMELPGELRNRIWEYALTTDKRRVRMIISGNVARKHNLPHNPTPPAARGALSMTTTRRDTGLEVFNNTFWLQSHSGLFKDLLRACERNPKIKVRFCLPGLLINATQPQRFVEHGMALRLALRGEDFSYLAPRALGPTEVKNKRKLKKLGDKRFLGQHQDEIKRLGRQARNLKVCMLHLFSSMAVLLYQAKKLTSFEIYTSDMHFKTDNFRQNAQYK
ncbi:hypothetical protein BU23DRAFT_628064 [Bimuria novae-zelandiae CBS 107.79]|uniref:Uncharacterized protein n=1 Tax=Bimuria novae-zelandiae CBS 107.79 TaxID=1447943 RepID=A0A6A5VNM4_9PLEO|nr:hypothetical protein BU23DRAFT_628064 [Bimuria novae-zelandiae CBS 107.79]